MCLTVTLDDHKIQWYSMTETNQQELNPISLNKILSLFAKN